MHFFVDSRTLCNAMSGIFKWGVKTDGTADSVYEQKKAFL